MKKAVLLSMAFAAMLSSTDAPAAGRLLFEMSGSRDGAMPGFSIVAGLAFEPTPKTIYVTSELYAEISRLVAKAGAIKATADTPCFAVTEFRNTSAMAAVLIPDKVVGDIMRNVVMIFERQHQAVPAIALEIAASLP